MERIGSKLQKQGVIMALFTLGLISAGCDERIDTPKVNPSEGEMVEVSLNIGFADEADGAALPAATTTKGAGISANEQAFDVQLVPYTHTKTVTASHPDKFYYLDIHQYKADGTHLASFTVSTSSGSDIGTVLNVSLNNNGNQECQLLIIARGATQAVSSLSGKSLADVRKQLANAATIKAVGVENGDNINNMPYLLYLPKVKIESNKLVSPDGTDVRLLLKRLAVGVTIDWTFSDGMTNKGYELKEVRLMQVPADYRILPETETEALYGEMYPISVSEFVDGFRLKGTDLLTITSQTFWMSANARGTRNDINSPNQRSKDKAHSAATYVEFVVDNTSKKERLLYRAYLGANATTDFNLLENTNYHWKVNINNANYTTDDRIQLLDQTPVTSLNLQQTANCFMMRPGTNICFNPYKHEAGTDGWNTNLIANGTIQEGKEISYVKVLWQTKDAGTNGDLVLGYVVNDNNHQNLVNLTDERDKDNARIHVKVPLTNGGNAVIAAYNAEGIIVWSWHLWISDYVPVGLKDFTAGDATARQKAISAAQNATEGGTVNTYDGDGTTYKAPAWTQSDGAFHKSVIMDRNLGAIRGTFSTASTLDAARAYGNIYQWGRKDPFTGSVDGTETDINVRYDGDGNALSFKTATGNSNSTTAKNYAIQNPDIYVITTSTTGGYLLPGDSWNTATGLKAIYDPCPKGWRVPNFDITSNYLFQAIYAQGASAGTLKFLRKEQWLTTSVSGNVDVNRDNAISNGFLYYPKTGTLTDEEKQSKQAAWFPAIRLRERENGKLRVVSSGTYVPSFAMWGAVRGGASVVYGGNYMEFKINNSGNTPNGSPFLFGSTIHTYGFGVRCIQEQK